MNTDAINIMTQERNNWQYTQFYVYTHFYPFYDQNEIHWCVKLYPIYFILFLSFSLTLFI